MERIITLNVNGEDHKVIVRSHESLLDVLRNKLGLTGTKECCNEGDCGACTVIMGGRAVNACLVLAVEAEGQEIQTVEGLAQGTRLHPLQEAFLEVEAMQCGYCTAGMILSGVALLRKNANPDEAAIKRAMQGNVCRCGTYPRIVAAVRLASKGAKA